MREDTKAFVINSQQVATAQRAGWPMVAILGTGLYVSVVNKEQVEQLLRACQFALGMEELP
jgi:indole-3-glycerol phosphate synthase